MKRLICFYLVFVVLASTRPFVFGQSVQPCALPGPVAPDPLLPKPAGVPFWVPQAPAYPYFGGGTREQLVEKAKCISQSLENYIKAWMDGKVAAEIPERFLPSGYDKSQYRHFRLVKPADCSVGEQWGIRPAENIDPSGARGGFPDPNVTYLVGSVYAPFGSKMVIEGEFPHARFFDIQVSPSFWPENYRYNNTFGVPEVPLVDCDIVPEKGSTNPFLVGADRNALSRSYRVTYTMDEGDPTVLNEAFRPPHYRAPGNTRSGSGIQYQGPWGGQKKGGNGLGLWDKGSIWIRYYAPDRKAGARGGVPLPKIHYELPDGRAYYILIDQAGMIAMANKRVKVKPTAGKSPALNSSYASSSGWYKEFGIFRAISQGVAINTKSVSPEGKRYVRDLDRGVTSRGEELPGAAHYEPSATSATYVSYLLRGMSCEAGKVVVLTGRLPVTPETRAGNSVTKKAEARYWSLTGYSVPTGGELIAMAFDRQAVTGVAVQSVYDEEIIKDKNNDFTLVISRPEDRPRNATAENGVTWMDWGPRGEVSWTLRWLSVYPEWSFPLSPGEDHLPWKTGDWASPKFDPSLLSDNLHPGFLGAYQPVIHYLSRLEFEKLGNRPSAADIPIWKP